MEEGGKQAPPAFPVIKDSMWRDGCSSQSVGRSVGKPVSSFQLLAFMYNTIQLYGGGEQENDTLD